MTDEEFLAALNAARDADESDVALAGRMGVDTRTFRGWKAGEHRPTPATKDRVLKRLTTEPGTASRRRTGSAAATGDQKGRDAPPTPQGGSMQDHPLREAIALYANKIDESRLLEAVTALERIWRGLPGSTRTNKGAG